MRNVSDKSCRENQNTHFVLSGLFFPPENRGNVEKTVQRGRPQMTMWRMRTACWITKATNTHTQVV